MSASLPSTSLHPALVATVLQAAEVSCLAQIKAIRRAASLAASLGHEHTLPFVRIQEKCLLFCGADDAPPVEHTFATLPVSVGVSGKTVEIVPNVPLPCNTALASRPASVEWMLDSGAALDLISREHVSASGLPEHPTSQPAQVQTAAGPLTVETMAPMSSIYPAAGLARQSRCAQLGKKLHGGWV